MPTNDPHYEVIMRVEECLNSMRHGNAAIGGAAQLLLQAPELPSESQEYAIHLIIANNDMMKQYIETAKAHIRQLLESQA